MVGLADLLLNGSVLYPGPITSTPFSESWILTRDMRSHPMPYCRLSLIFQSFYAMQFSCFCVLLSGRFIDGLLKVPIKNIACIKWFVKKFFEEKSKKVEEEGEANCVVRSVSMIYDKIAARNERG